MLEPVQERGDTANLYVSIYGISGLINNILFTAIKIILKPGCLIYADFLSIAEEFTPIRLYWPAPSVRIQRIGIYKAQIVNNYTAITLAEGKPN